MATHGASGVVPTLALEIVRTLAPLPSVSHPSLVAGLLRHEEHRHRDDKRPRRDQDNAVTQCSLYVLKGYTYGPCTNQNLHAYI